MCSTKFIIFAAFGLCILASTVFGHGGGGRSYHGFGKFSRYGNLTQEQRQELKELKQTLKLGNATKQQYQDSLQSFFEGVGGDSLVSF
uniref:Uncharacterized protein n=1 Tax=Panagrolaimus davidi TaxID=227884 RepID=A0A914PSW2_9BILA